MFAVISFAFSSRFVSVQKERNGNGNFFLSTTVDYMAVRGSDPGPFFRFRNGEPLTKSKFTQEVRSAMEAVGLPHTQFAGHSFRIGAATAATRAGVEDLVIRTLGRWKSSAFLAYIRTPREQLSQFSRTLVGN